MFNRSSRLLEAFAAHKLILTEGAMVERLRRNPLIKLDPFVANASLLFSQAGRQALSSLWREYIVIAQKHSMEILLYTPTWRVNGERLALAGLPDVGQVAIEAFVLLDSIRSEYSEFGNEIYIGGLVGCKGDAYAPQDALDVDEAEDFHRPHVNAFAKSGIDLLLATTLPALSEATGLAKAMSDTDVAYGISFVLRPNGTLLDGTPIADAIAAIDGSVDKPPVAYFANCVHPDNLYLALSAAVESHPEILNRFLGLQGNTSRKSPEELDESVLLDTDDPEAFAFAMHAVREKFSLSVLGGCCGTDNKHIAAIAEQCMRN
jgi:homocysteine S-methyltransferase